MLKTAITILIADDDDVFRELLEDILKRQGYQILSAPDGEAALDLFWKYSVQIDLLILDVMMPKYSGWDVIKEIREHSEVPVLMLTALGDESSEISGLLLGADDYITKPFKYGVFLARVESLTRKAKKSKEQNINAGCIFIEQRKQTVLVDGKEVSLSRKEYELLLMFVKNKNILFTREQLIDRIWGYDFEGDIRTVDTHIKTLRAKLGEAGQMIKTLRGSGYRLEEQQGGI